MKNFIQLFAVLLLLFLSGCSEKKLDLPNIGIPDSQINEDLVLEAYSAFNTFKIGEPITLEVRLKSEATVQVSPDSASQIFIQDHRTGSWQVVKEVPDLGVFESQTFVLTSDETGINEISVSIFPKLTPSSKPIDLLIFITGNIIEGEKVTEKKTSSYIIVRLKP
jgi:hypothetical protein